MFTRALYCPYPEPDQSNPYYPSLSKIHFNIILPPLSKCSYWSLSSWFSHQNPVCIPRLPLRATCLVDLILLHLIILIILRKWYKLWSSSLWSFLQPPVTSSLFGPNILLSTLFSNTLSLCPPPSSVWLPTQVPKMFYKNIIIILEGHN
jgi:hypothetical protein